MESYNEEWDQNFSNEVGELEFINAIEINNENGEEYCDISPKEKEKKIKAVIINLKKLIKNKLD
ncbi:MAG: hypothetical protein H0T62_01425 [Parachlamydiaceae bacterium]|nr:hypothetical protein [Parachlamydiaceae bacterium]